MNVYDFDGTIYNGDSTVDFFLYALTRKPSLIRYLPKQAWGSLLYGLNRIGKTKLKEYFFCFLRGIDAEELAESFWEKNCCKIYKWYSERQKQDDIIISASPEFLLMPICRRLGVSRLIASKVDKKTGKYSGENCRGEEKVRRLISELNVTRIDNFYSDSKSDLPLAQISDKAFMLKNGKITEWKGF